MAPIACGPSALWCGPRGSGSERRHPAKGAGGPADRPINEQVQVVLAMRSGVCLVRGSTAFYAAFEA